MIVQDLVHKEGAVPQMGGQDVAFGEGFLPCGHYLVQLRCIYLKPTYGNPSHLNKDLQCLRVAVTLLAAL